MFFGAQQGSKELYLEWSSFPFRRRLKMFTATCICTSCQRPKGKINYAICYSVTTPEAFSAVCGWVMAV